MLSPTTKQLFNDPPNANKPDVEDVAREPLSFLAVFSVVAYKWLISFLRPQH